MPALWLVVCSGQDNVKNIKQRKKHLNVEEQKQNKIVKVGEKKTVKRVSTDVKDFEPCKTIFSHNDIYYIYLCEVSWRSQRFLPQKISFLSVWSISINIKKNLGTRCTKTFCLLWIVSTQGDFHIQKFKINQPSFKN